MELIFFSRLMTPDIVPGHAIGEQAESPRTYDDDQAGVIGGNLSHF